ncbi:hypothetical protein PAAG_11176 [Paracoccidioides lutzii Pb01]|uniref:Uncharacterized protein n=1 Tax=Paracoccidioides lutzii (strain ATCC MYA-826 / Pb01) TaxID=502779 RepID=A0A0A2V6M1_PARBA|nr:hypothetical protein PAAG_11176 [Paracoccidioides lutzii Pb01]KGQ02002.1 hypothetical protein PAAG_11176 [Paracoccidioides lutzii Pb01]
MSIVYLVKTDGQQRQQRAPASVRDEQTLGNFCLDILSVSSVTQKTIPLEKSDSVQGIYFFEDDTSVSVSVYGLLP